MPHSINNKNSHISQSLLGAHTSIQGGLENALYEGQKLGCSCIQMFTHSNRQWKIKSITVEEQEIFHQAKKKTGISQIAVHASYLINLGSPNPSTSHLSRVTIEKELERCEFLGIPFLIVHPGAALNDSVEICIQRISDNLSKVFEAVPYCHTKILLENMAGQGSVVGSTLEQLAVIKKTISKQHHQRVGFCIDLCHAFAAGYDFTTLSTYKSFWKHCDDTLGLGHIHALHMNDSLKDHNSRVDRHAHIGRGKIGIEAFRLIMNDERFVKVLKILETPIDQQGDFATNLAMLRSLIK